MASGGMTIPWDGKNELGQTIDGAFTWVVTANVTSTVAGPGGGLTARDQKSIQAKTKKPIVIEVFANMKGQRKRVALYKPGDSSMIDLQKHIFPYGRSGQDNTLEFEMTGPEPTQPFVAWVLELHSTVSDAVERVTLAKAGGKFKGKLTIGPSLIKEGTSLTKGGQPVRTTATATLAYGNIRSDEPSTFLRELLQQTISSKVFPPEVQSLGPLDDALAGIQPRGSFSEVALPTIENLACFGFEAIEISLVGKAEIATVLKIRHPATHVWIGSHGGDDGTILTLDDAKTQKLALPGRDILPDDTRHLKTLILSACQALDLHDYNNHLHPSGALIADRPSPGLLWWNASTLGRGADGGHTTLLGFNRISNAGAWIAYRDELQRLSNISTVSKRDIEAWAWMKSNFNESKSDRRVQGAAACAWSGDYYYYIPYRLSDDPKRYWEDPEVIDPVTKRLKRYKKADLNTIKTIRRIHKDDWNRNPESWSQIPNFAIPVGIPQEVSSDQFIK